MTFASQGTSSIKETCKKWR